MQKNISLAYILTFFRYSWFWLGIWVLFYLRFTNYAGIGLIESSMIIVLTVTEIPTGAVADLFGKRKTLIISMLFQAIGGMWMVFAQSVFDLIGSVSFIAIGSSFYSGTLEALVYDTLKQENQEEKYDRVIATIQSLDLVFPAVCGIIGGYLYGIAPNLPFFVNAMCYFIGTVVAFFFIEPKIDSEKFSLKNYLRQVKQGFRQLTKTAEIREQTLLLLSIGVIVVILDEMLNHFLGLEFGFSQTAMGWFWGVALIVAAGASQLSPWVKKILGEKQSIFYIGVIMVISLVFSPLYGMLFGTLSLILRNSLQALYWNLSSAAINRNTESRYRATTLSTFNMAKNIPYALLATFVGGLADSISARYTALYLGLVMGVLLLVQFLQKLRPFHTKLALKKSYVEK